MFQYLKKLHEEEIHVSVIQIVSVFFYRQIVFYIETFKRNLISRPQLWKRLMIVIVPC